MKLNATSEMIPVTWPQFANIHPFIPSNQVTGYKKLIDELGSWLINLTGFHSISLQPNSGAQGEYAGLMIIRAYHKAQKNLKRNVCLIPSSAHGTNPASAVMAGMKVVVIKCDDDGNIDIEITKYALKSLNVDRFGLDEMDNKILTTLIKKFNGQPVGLNTLSTAVSETAETIEEVYEPFLIQEGFLLRTPRGRQVTKKAYNHLDIQISNSQKDLFD